MNRTTAQLSYCGDGFSLLTGRQRFAVVLAMCLPVPVLAATGMNVPLPSSVYRLATEIVAGTEALATRGEAPDASINRPSGSIVLSRQERSGQQVSIVRPGAVQPAATSQPTLQLRTDRDRFASQRVHSFTPTPSARLLTSGKRTKKAAPVVASTAVPAAATSDFTQQSDSTDSVLVSRASADQPGGGAFGLTSSSPTESLASAPPATTKSVDVPVAPVTSAATAPETTITETGSNAGGNGNGNSNQGTSKGNGTGDDSVAASSDAGNGSVIPAVVTSGTASYGAGKEKEKDKDTGGGGSAPATSHAGGNGNPHSGK